MTRPCSRASAAELRRALAEAAAADGAARGRARPTRAPRRRHRHARPATPSAATLETELDARARRRAPGRRSSLLDIDGFRALNAPPRPRRRRRRPGRRRRAPAPPTRAGDVLGRTGADEFAVAHARHRRSPARATCCDRLIAELEAERLPARASSPSRPASPPTRRRRRSATCSPPPPAASTARAPPAAAAPRRPADGGVDAAAAPRPHVIDALASTLLERDRYTGEHSEVVVELAGAVAERPRPDADEIERVARRGAAARHRQGRRSPTAS